MGVATALAADLAAILAGDGLQSLAFEALGATRGNPPSAELRLAMLADLARAIHQSDMRVPVDPHVWRFDELRPALESLAGGRHFGKIALRF